MRSQLTNALTKLGVSPNDPNAKPIVALATELLGTGNIRNPDLAVDRATRKYALALLLSVAPNVGDKIDRCVAWAHAVGAVL